jgi:hypothetical protein
MADLGRTLIPGESRTTFFQTVFGVWFLVWIFAALHNQYLIRIHPEHFTVWHYRIPWTDDLTLLGITYALGASISPGLILGTALYIVGRLFDRPKISLRTIFLGVAAVFVAVEISALLAGFVSWRSGSELYPEWLYPDSAPGLLITQSIQITAYLSGAIFSLLLLIGLWIYRGRLRDQV